MRNDGVILMAKAMWCESQYNKFHHCSMWAVDICGWCVSTSRTGPRCPHVKGQDPGVPMSRTGPQRPTSRTCPQRPHVKGQDPSVSTSRNRTSASPCQGQDPSVLTSRTGPRRLHVKEQDPSVHLHMRARSVRNNNWSLTTIKLDVGGGSFTRSTTDADARSVCDSWPCCFVWRLL